MKILSLRFTNINSLKGEHIISFQEPPLAASGLILITGPTGSGKSTLLDVISLALYNRIPRLPAISKKEVDELNSIMTHHTREAKAEVYYESNGQRYISRWSIEVNRNGNLNDYHMEIWHEDSQQILDLKKSEVAAKNAEIIGLNYEQFIKSIVLSQGEFAQFLKARHEERAELLEKITGTEIYRQIGKKTYEKHKEAKQALGSIQDLIMQMPEASETEHKILTEDLHKAEIELNQQNSEYDNLVKHLHSYDAFNKKTEDLQKTKGEYQNWKQQQETIEGLKAQINQFDRLLHLKGDLQMLDAAEKDLANLVQEKIDLQSNLNRLTSDIIGIKSLLSKRLSETGDLHQIQKEIDSIKNAMLSYENDIATLQKKGLQQRQQSEQIAGSLPPALCSWYHAKINPITALQAIEALMPVMQEKEGEFKEDLLVLQQKRDHLIQQERKLSEVRLRKEKKDAIVKEILDTEKLIVSHEKELAELKNKIESGKLALQQLTAKLAKLRKEKEEQLSKAALNDLRAGLKDGEACPLCGATSHPYCDQELTFSIGTLEIDIHQQEKLFHQTDELLKKEVARYSGLEAQLHLHHGRVEELKNQQTEIDNSIATSGFEDTPHETLDSQMNNIQKEIEKYQQRIQAEQITLQLQPLKNVYNEMENIRKEMEALKLKRDQQLPADNEWDEIQKAFGQLQKLLEDETINTISLNHKNERIQALEIQQQKLLLTLSEPLNSIGIRDYHEAMSILDQAQVNAQNKSRVQDHESMGASIKDRIYALENELKVLSEELPEGQDWQKSKQRLEELKTNIHDLTENKGRVQQKILHWKESKKRYDSLSLQKEEALIKLRKYELLNQLIGDAQGKNFSNFAQELTMQHIIMLANHRLSGLTERYQLVLPKEEGRTDLFVRDLHLGGSERSVKTLSGGETFILSLALALSLSDLASRNVRLDCLFIDEGFGTLDNDTLDTVISTLERLQEESDKLIGIISHVESLKERIITQIKLVRDTSGISKIEMVG